MRTYKELHNEWKANQSLRGDLYAFLQTPGWRHLCEMIQAKAVEDAETWQRLEGDPVLARNLSHQKGARWALYAIQHACDPDEREQPAEPAPYEHITEDYLAEKKLPNA